MQKEYKVQEAIGNLLLYIGAAIAGIATIVYIIALLDSNGEDKLAQFTLFLSVFIPSLVAAGVGAIIQLLIDMAHNSNQNAQNILIITQIMNKEIETK